MTGVARDAAAQMLAADIITGRHGLQALGEAMDDDWLPNKVLRLRSSAVIVNWESISAYPFAGRGSVSAGRRITIPVFAFHPQ